MAQIIGTSGAWKSVCIGLRTVGLYPEKLSEIAHMQKAAIEEYQLARNKNTQEIDNHIVLLKKELHNFETNLEDTIQEYRNKISAEIEFARRALQLLQENVSFIQKVLNFFKIRAAKEKIRLLQDQYESCPQKFQKKLDLTKKNFDEAQSNRESLIENKCRVEKYKVELLESAHSSPDLAGAIAELELIESLKKLPDNYYVISDINLSLDRAIYFDDEWLRSAQIDHVVISSCGIFVIEVKNWSRNFTQHGDYFNPYQQVKRASYLCYKLIGERYNLKTRSIIAHKGAIPGKPRDSHAKVLSIHEVKDYILWFKDAAATNQTVQLVANQLSKY
jgi:cellobiose-specific phosphotransferase system component IIA